MQTLATLRIGDFDVEPSLNRLHKGHEMLAVEPRVMDLLMLLAEAPGQVFGREEILQRVWPETTVQDDALRRVVTLLRRVLDDDPKQPRYIETIPRRGYRLVAPCRDRTRSRPARSRGKHLGWRPASCYSPASALQPAGWPSAEALPKAPPVPSWTCALLPACPAMSRSRRSRQTAAALPSSTRKAAGARLLVKGIRDAEARRILERPRLANPVWSPGGDRLLVVVRGDDCQILSAKVDDPSTVQSLYACSEGERLDQVVQPDDETLILTRRPARFGSSWRVHRYDLVTHESTQLTLPAEPGHGDFFLALSPDRRRLAVIRHLIGERSKLLLLDWASGAQEVVDRFPDTPGGSPGLRTGSRWSTPTGPASTVSVWKAARPSG